MSKRCIHSLVLATILCGCAHVPELPSESQVNAQHMIRAIRCEIRHAYVDAVKQSNEDARDAPQLYPKGKNGFYDNRQYTITLNLKVEDKGSATASAGFVVPISILPPQSVTITPDIGLEATNTRSAELKFFDKFPKTKCDRPKARDGASWLLGGSTGLYEWLTRVRNTADHPNFKESIFKTITYTLSFVVKPNGGVGVSYLLIPSGLNRLNGSGAFGFDKTKTHSLTISLDTFSLTKDPDETIIVNSFGKEAAALLTDLAAGKAKIEAEADAVKRLNSELAKLPQLKAQVRNEETENKLIVNSYKVESERLEKDIQSFANDPTQLAIRMLQKNNLDQSYFVAKQRDDSDYYAERLSTLNQQRAELQRALENAQVRLEESRQQAIAAARRKARSISRASRDEADSRRSEAISDLADIRRKLDELTLD